LPGFNDIINYNHFFENVWIFFFPSRLLVHIWLKLFSTIIYLFIFKYLFIYLFSCFNYVGSRHAWWWLSGVEYRKKLEVLNLLSNTKGPKVCCSWYLFFLFWMEFGRKLHERLQRIKSAKIICKTCWNHSEDNNF
jgi:hypothetical protein